jgi:hypothetical protein
MVEIESFKTDVENSSVKTSPLFKQIRAFVFKMYSESSSVPKLSPADALQVLAAKVKSKAKKAYLIDVLGMTLVSLK